MTNKTNISLQFFPTTKDNVNVLNSKTYKYNGEKLQKNIKLYWHTSMLVYNTPNAIKGTVFKSLFVTPIGSMFGTEILPGIYTNSTDRALELLNDNKQ